MSNKLVGILIFFFNDTATTEIYTLSLHDALPIFRVATRSDVVDGAGAGVQRGHRHLRLARIDADRDRKSTRLNSSHSQISYAVFCLKKTIYTTESGSAILMWFDDAVVTCDTPAWR